MPTYVYKFIDTGETIEVQQSFTDDALTEAVHPATGAVMPVKKIITPVGVTFKGGGFYKTDSRSGSGSSSGSSSASTSSSDSSNGSSGSSDGSSSGSGSGSGSDSSSSSSTPSSSSTTASATTS
jgi:predicted nucleic acid-binding Zn ribbon protein